jgi:hypothetical protein
VPYGEGVQDVVLALVAGDPGRVDLRDARDDREGAEGQEEEAARLGHVPRQQQDVDGVEPRDEVVAGVAAEEKGRSSRRASANWPWPSA